MTARAALFRGTSGLQTKVDPARLFLDKDTGMVPVPSCMNVWVDDSGRISSREGYTQHVALSGAHSLFCDGGHALCVAGDTLYRVLGNSVAVLRDGLTADVPMRYVQVNDDIFFCNGHENGRYNQSDGVVHAWTGNTRVGPWTPRHIEDPPVGHLLSFYRGRVYIADGNALWFSEPLAYSWVVKEDNFILFDSHITMIAPVLDGLYVSDANRTYFFQGTSPEDFARRTICDYPAIEGVSTILADGRMAGRSQPLGPVALWASTRGLCRGETEGVFVNVTESRINMPDVSSGCVGMFKDQYIFILE